MAEPTLEELEKTNPNYSGRYDNPNVDRTIAPPPRNPLAMRRYTPAGPSATSYNPNSYDPAQSRPQSGVVRVGPTVNYTERTGITAGPVETFQRQADGSITRDGVTVRPPRVSAAGDFASAARQPMQASRLQVNPIQAAQDKGAAMRRQAADMEQRNANTANGYKADAISALLGEWRKNGRVEAMPQSAPIYGAAGADGKPRIVGYGPAAPTAGDPTRRIAMLEPAAVRELNSMRKQLGLGETDKIVGMVAVGDGKADAQTGKPTFVIRYRDANGRIRSEAMSYGSAARFVQDARKAGGNANAEYDMANDAMWGDPLRYKGTAGYLETKGRLDAADLKNRQTQTQINATAAQTGIAQNADARAERQLAGNERRADAADARAAEQQAHNIKIGRNADARAASEEARKQTKFEQEQQAAATAKEQKPVTDAEARAKEYLDRADKVQKDSPEVADAYRKVAADFIRQAESARGKIAARKTAEERRAEAARAKPGDQVSFEPNAVWGENGTLVPKPGFEEKNGKFVRAKPQKPGAKPVSTQSATPVAAPPSSAASKNQENNRRIAAMRKEIESGGGKYEEDADGYRTIHIGNWDYLPDYEKRNNPMVYEESASRGIDTKAIRAVQKMANEAKAKFDKKRKAEEDRFRKTLEDQDLTPGGVETRVRRHMDAWDAKNDPKTRGRIQDQIFSAFVSDF